MHGQFRPGNRFDDSPSGSSESRERDAEDARNFEKDILLVADPCTDFWGRQSADFIYLPQFPMISGNSNHSHTSPSSQTGRQQGFGEQAIGVKSPQATLQTVVQEMPQPNLLRSWSCRHLQSIDLTPHLRFETVSDGTFKDEVCGLCGARFMHADGGPNTRDMRRHAYEDHGGQPCMLDKNYYTVTFFKKHLRTYHRTGNVKNQSRWEAELLKLCKNSVDASARTERQAGIHSESVEWVEDLSDEERGAIEDHGVGRPFAAAKGADIADAQADKLQIQAHVEGDMACTDSGYASASNMKYPVNNQSMDNRGQNQDERRPPCRGEGYQGGTQTEFSVATTADAPRSLITELSRDIYSRLGGQVDLSTWPKLATALPRLIKAFALRIGREGRSQMHRDIMYFVYKWHK
jgi:hypothetical protein